LIEAAAALSAGRHRISFHVEEIDLKGNHDELASAFANLLSNAVNYTGDGDRIAVIWWGNGCGTLSVIDDGIGIAEEHLDRLTERFIVSIETRIKAAWLMYEKAHLARPCLARFR